METADSREFGTRVRPWDVLVHAAVPLALLLVYLAPIPYERFLYLPGRSGLANAYWSALGHADLSHLLTNLFGYAVLVTLSFALLGQSRRRLYYVLFLVTLLSAPPLTAGLLEAYVLLGPLNPGKSPGGAGFSIVTAALLALLSGAIALSPRRPFEHPASVPLIGLSLFSLAAAVPAARIGAPAALAAGLGTIGAGYLGFTAWRLLGRAGTTSPATIALQSSATAIFVGSAADLFLLESRAWVGHFLGFVSGFAVVWGVIGLLLIRSRVRRRR